LGPEDPSTLTTKHNIADVYRYLGDYLEALNIYKEVFAVRERVLGPEDPSTLTNKHNIADVYRYLGDYLEALNIYKEVLVAKERVLGATHPSTLTTKHNIAGVYNDLGDYFEALNLYEEILVAEERILGPDHPLTAFTAFNFGYTYYLDKNVDMAIFFVKKSVSSTQRTRSSLSALDVSLQDNYLKKVEYRYHFLAKLLIDAGREEEAQAVILLLKMDETFDPALDDPLIFTNAAREIIIDNTSESSAIEGYNALSNTLAALGREQTILLEKQKMNNLNVEETARLEALDNDIIAAKKDFQNFLDALPQILSASREEYKAEEVKYLKSIRETLRIMGDGTVLIHTLAAENSLYLFFTTSDNVLLVKESPISRANLEKKIGAFYALLHNPALDPRPAGNELYDLIIAPLALELQGANAKTIMFSLDGPLRYIPMSALYDGKKFLAETYATALFIDTAKDKLREKPTPTPKAIGFGVTKAHDNFPALTAVQDELNAIIRSDSAEGGVIQGESFFDESFTKEELFECLRAGFSIIHIASHFKFVGAKGQSYLLLGDGNPLTVSNLETDMFFEELDLLTLSACDTATGIAGGTGVEVESLGDVVLENGVMAVLATLWPVNDASTGLLMADFYSLRFAQSLNKAEALRRAQLNLMGNAKTSASTTPRGVPIAAFGSVYTPSAAPWDGKGFSHPYYWAPFVLMGNWR
jgi:CHAT domain-containing protein